MGEGVLSSGIVYGSKTKKSLMTDRKILFSPITKLSKQSTLLTTSIDTTQKVSPFIGKLLAVLYCLFFNFSRW